MPSTPDPLLEVIAAALHDGAPWEYVDENVRDSYRQDAHQVLAAITTTGRLLPAGGTDEVQHRYRDPDGFTCIGLSSAQVADGDDWRLSDRRIVTRWPDGRWHFGPWEPASTPDTTGTEEGA